MGMNFFSHARYLTGKPINKSLLLLANLVDIGVITVLVAFWSDQTGLNSNFYILYYPVLFAWALVFSPSITSLFSLITLTAYCATCLLRTDSPLMYSVAASSCYASGSSRWERWAAWARIITATSATACER